MSVDALLLSLLWVLPLAGALLVLLLPRRSEPAIKVTALVVTLLTFALTVFLLPLYWNLAPEGTNHFPSLAERAALNTLTPVPVDTAFDAHDNPLDLVVRLPWVPSANIQYYLGVDGISLSLLILTGLISLLACLASFHIEKQVKGYFALFLLLVSSMMGVFLALDLVLFFVFFEVMLLPMYFLIAVWGGENREYAAIKFLLYTLSGSVLILVAVLLLFFWAGPGDQPLHTFDILALTAKSATSARPFRA